MLWHRSPPSSATQPRDHIAVVEAYDGRLEHVSADAQERRAARGLGLPLEALARRLDCDVTVLGWDDWFRKEGASPWFTDWIPFPATRPCQTPAPPPSCDTPGITRLRIAPRDPFSGVPFGQGLSPPALGLLANSDPLFLASYCLDGELRRLWKHQPFTLMVLPAWGGLGYVAQFARATGVPDAVDVPAVVVVTDGSARRHSANQEGEWTRPAVTRRQMEDVSIALADHVLVFGNRGRALAMERRLPDASRPILVPRRLPEAVADAGARRERHRGRQPAFALHEPQEPASGVLVALDAWRLLHSSAAPAPQIVVSGPDTVFAPMRPRSFIEYWGERGFVRELVHAATWQWRTTRRHAFRRLTLRVYPSAFEHLPDLWSELASGSLILVSPAALEGSGAETSIPEPLALPEHVTAEQLAAAVDTLAGLSPDALEELRHEVCGSVLGAGVRDRHEAALDPVVHALRSTLEQPPSPQELGRVALLFTDRTLPLRELAERASTGRLADGRRCAGHPPRASQAARPAATPARGSGLRDGALSVVVTCYNMGTLVSDAVHSLWRSSRMPDELILIEDGSNDGTTLATVAAIEREATTRGMPLTVVRTRNAGLPTARNTGLAMASGEFISFFDGDDLIEPGFYEAAVRLLTRHPGLGGVACWAVCFSDERIEGYWNAPQPELPLLLVENTVVVPCVMRTAEVRQLGGYDTRHRFSYEDWELFVRLVASGRPVVTIPMYLERYRVRPASLLRTMTTVQHQYMRETLFGRHRELVARFGVEVAMLIEGQLARYLYPDTR